MKINSKDFQVQESNTEISVTIPPEIIGKTGTGLIKQADGAEIGIICE